ncbi:MAG: hypothetical protein EOL87_07185 [Spartobacteria bacterium]|nr:hypothetical protein [Spartobacteria bacterium]
MGKWLNVIVTLFVALIIWGMFLWPLPKYANEGIAISSVELGGSVVQRMSSGEHLRYIQQHKIEADNLWDTTVAPVILHADVPAFPAWTSIKKIPFSILFLTGYKLHGLPAGLNLTQFICLWLHILFTFLLVKDFTHDTVCAMMAAAITVCIPYGWNQLITGSAEGLIWTTTPMVLWGLSAIIRRKSLWGALCAGLGMSIAAAGNIPLLYFEGLFIPFWCIMIRINKTFNPGSPKRLVKTIIVWLLFLVPVTVIFYASTNGFEPTTSPMQTALLRRCTTPFTFSSPWKGLLFANDFGTISPAYIGLGTPILLAIGLLLITGRLCIDLRTHIRSWFSFILIIISLITFFLLILRDTNPAYEAWLAPIRPAIPLFSSVKQFACLFPLLPPLLAIGIGFSLSALRMRPRTRPGTHAVLPLLVTLVICFSYKRQVNPSICLLDAQNTAYAAVEKSAEVKQQKASALVLPIMPLSTSSSPAESSYFAALNHIQIATLNTNSLSSDTLLSIQCGAIAPPLLDQWLDEEMHYLLFHQSIPCGPFTSALTLYHLLNHPRLECIGQQGDSWSFRILEENRPVDIIPSLNAWQWFFSTDSGSFDVEKGTDVTEEITDTRLNGRSTHAAWLYAGRQNTLHIGRLPLCALPSPYILLHVKGRGTLQIRIHFPDGTGEALYHAVDAEKWSWIQVALSPRAAATTFESDYFCEDGELWIDTGKIISGALPELKRSAWNIPAPLFFHQGYIDLDHWTVNFDPEHHLPGGRQGLFYGPDVPILPAGDYEVEIVFKSDAELNTVLGQFYFSINGRAVSQDYEVFAGRRAFGWFSSSESDFPVMLHFIYARTAPIAIESVIFRHR